MCIVDVKMIRVPLLTLTLTACAALRPFRAPQTQKDTVLGRRDLGAAAVAAVAALAPAAARAEPRDQWIAAQKEIDSILADWPIAGGGDGIRRRRPRWASPARDDRRVDRVRCVGTRTRALAAKMESISFCAAIHWSRGSARAD